MSTSTPIVSVVLPFYNAEETLNRAIESIYKQNFHQWECLLINNNSVDKSTEIALAWTKKDARFMLLHEKKQGVMFASNKGAEHAKGKYIARMDADDISLPNRLKLQSEFLDNNSDYEVISGLVEYVPHNSKTEGFQRYVNWVNSIKSYNEILNNMFVESPIVNPTAMWRSVIGLKHGMYKQGDFPEDYELWLRWISKGVKIKKLDSVVLEWFDSENRLTRTDPIYSDEAFFRIKTQYLANWLRKNNPNYPQIAIWGASRISRRYTSLLEDYGLEISFYIDIKKSRQLDKDVVYYEDISSTNKTFILIYMKHQVAKAKIKKYLKSKLFIEAKHYLFVS